MTYRGRARPSMAALAAALVATVVTVAGCGTGSAGAEGQTREDLRAKTSASPTPRPTPSPTAACPTVDGQQAPPGCAPYDGEAAMRENEAYRQRFELSKSLQDRAENHRKRIAAAFAEAVEKGPLDQLNVSRVLAPLGYDASSVQSYGRSDVGGGLAVGVSTDAGCVYGGVRGNAVDLQTGGGIADGGCLPAKGH